MSVNKKDLVVLTADKDALLGIGALLQPTRLGIREITFECRAHPKHDSGVIQSAHDFLRPFLRYYEYAVVVFDLEGCGRENRGRTRVEQEMETQLAANGWEGRCAAVVIEPELEAWLWDASLRVGRLLKWDRGPLKEWLLRNEYLASDAALKPARPKEAFRDALRATDQKISSSLFQDFAAVASIETCTDASFQKLLVTLRSWFGVF
jgi:hypothetical protein